jgi:tetratricopeptide (TPR) repeat protein
LKKHDVITILFIFRFVTALPETNDSLTAADYQHRAIEARDNNDIALSIKLLKKGLALCKTEYEFMRIYNSLGTSYYSQTDYHTALAYYDSSHALLDTIENPVFLAYLYNNYGLVYMDLGRFDKAIAYYTLARDKIDDSYKGLLFYNMALCNDYIGEEQKAKEYYNISYRYNKKYWGTLDYYTVLSGLELANYGETTLFGELKQSIDELGDTNLLFFYYFYTGDYKKAEQYGKNDIIFLLNVYVETKQWAKAVPLIDSLRTSYISVRSKLFLQENEMLIYKSAVDQALKTNIKQAFHYAQKSYGNILKEISGIKLSDSEDSYNYFDFDSVIYLFVISNKEYEFYKIGADNEFWEQYHAFMGTYDPNFKNDYYKSYIKFLESGNYLFKKLLPRTDKNMLIVAGGRLEHLPFECLPVRMPADTSMPNFKTIPYLIKESTIHYDFVLRSYTKPKGRKTITALAPDTTLQYALEEVKALKLFKSDRLIGKEAIKAEINHGEILHIATHYNPENFSIRFYDSTLNLDNLGQTHRDMVVLSTCLSGEGEFYTGEGIISPARQFYASGAECVLESDWNATDMSAYLIIWEFYKQLRRGKNKASALRKAKLKFLEETPHYYSHPFLWANFRIYGNNYPLRIAITPLLPVGTIIVFLLFVILIKYLLGRN